jgi:hypothetical protein
MMTQDKSVLLLIVIISIIEPPIIQPVAQRCPEAVITMLSVVSEMKQAGSG